MDSKLIACMTRCVVAAAAGMTLLSACNDKSVTTGSRFLAPSGGGTFAVSGVVSDASSLQPVPGVEIQWGDTTSGPLSFRQTLTNANGSYRLLVTQNLPSVVLRATKLGYVDETLVVQGGQDATVNFTLASVPPAPVSASTWSLNGLVTDSVTLQPLADVVVTWSDLMDDGVFDSTRSTASGEYRFTITRSESAIVVTAHKAGYADQASQVSLAHDVTLNFVLVPTPR